MVNENKQTAQTTAHAHSQKRTSVGKSLSRQGLQLEKQSLDEHGRQKQRPQWAATSIGKGLQRAKASVGKNFYGQGGQWARASMASGLHGQRPYWAFLKPTKLATRNSEP